MNYITVGDCCDILDSQRIPVTASDRTKGIYPYYGANGVQDYVDDFLFDDELVLVAEDGGHFGSKEHPIAYRVSGKCWVNNHAHVLKPREGVDVDYLCYSLMFYPVLSLIKGATRQKLNQSDLCKMKIILRPLDEQKRIAAKLACVDLVREKLQRQSEKLDTLVKSRFIEIFGDIKSPLFPISTIGDVCILKSGTTLPSDVESEDGEIPYVKVSDMNLPQNDTYIRTSTRYVSREDMGRTLIKKGSVIFPKRGAAIATNKKRILIHDTCCDLNIMGVLPQEKLRTTYLYNYFASMDLGSLYNGSTVPQLNNKDIAPLKIGIPPMELQIQFEEMFKLADKSKLVIRKLLEKQELLRAALMQEYFG